MGGAWGEGGEGTREVVEAILVEVFVAVGSGW